MGDLLKSNPIFEKLGFDESNQWILYADGMQEFFTWIANNIDEDNILTDEEVRIEEQLKASGEWCEGEELEAKLAEIEKKHPGFLTATEKDLDDLKEEVKVLQEMDKDYQELNAKLEETKSNLNCEISDLETELQKEEIRLEGLKKVLNEKIKEADEIDKANAELAVEMRKRFTEPHTPPLFMPEMPLDEYFKNIDLFLKYLKMYMDENVKIKTSPDEGGDDDEETDNIIDELKDLERQHYAAELKLVEAEIRKAGMKEMIEGLDISKVDVMTPSQMKSEIREMEAKNQKMETEIEAMMAELKILLKKKAQQKIEEVLYENTKIKYERASKRLEILEQLEQLTLEALNSGEMLWIAVQLDLEKLKHFIDNPIPSSANEAQACARRIEKMKQMQMSQTASEDRNVEVFVDEFANLLASHLNIQKPTTLNGCLYEYERFRRMSDNLVKGVLENKHRSYELNTLEELKSIEKSYSKFVYNGPTSKPIFENVNYLMPMYEIIETKNEIETTIRTIRRNIQTNITDKMNNDRFFRYQQLLWIWFLTEPKKVIQAIEEARKAASNAPNAKMLAGIKRKENET